MTPGVAGGTPAAASGKVPLDRALIACVRPRPAKFGPSIPVVGLAMTGFVTGPTLGVWLVLT